MNTTHRVRINPLAIVTQFFKKTMNTKLKLGLYYLTETLVGGGKTEDVVKVRSPEVARLPAASLDLTR